MVSSLEITLFAIWRIINLYHSLYINLMCKITRKREDERILTRIQLFSRINVLLVFALRYFISGCDVKTLNTWKAVIWYIINLFYIQTFYTNFVYTTYYFDLERCFAINNRFEKKVNIANPFCSYNNQNIMYSNWLYDWTKSKVI